MYEVLDDISVCFVDGDRKLSQLSQEELAQLHQQDHFKRYIKKKGRENKQVIKEEA